MAFNFSKFNVAGLPFKKLQEIWDEIEDKESAFKVNSLYINDKGNYGAAPVAVCDNFKLNLPQYMVGGVEELLADNEARQEMRRGHLGIRLIQYENGMGQFIGAEFCNI